MELILEITSEERHRLGDSATKCFQAVGGVIGRHPDCDWQILDEKRHLSGRHAVVSCEEDGFHITDISTNGVFVNNSGQPLGRNQRMKLSDADRLSMGNMEFVVRLDMTADSPGYSAPLRPGPGSPGKVDPLALFRARNGSEELPEPESTPTSSFSRQEQAVSAPNHQPPTQQAFTAPAMLPEDWLARPVPTLHSVKKEAAGVTAKREDPQPYSQVTAEQLLASFFKGVGLSPQLMNKVNGPQVMEEMGACLKANLNGMVWLMQQRAQLKNEFRMDMTLVQSEANNPLKFSASTKQAIKHLLKPQIGAFMSMQDAFRECYRDLDSHQVAVLAGVQGALRAVFASLAPGKIDALVDRDRARIPLSSRSARCWHKYQQLHQELDSGDDTFNRLFGDAFIKAYDEQTKRMQGDER